MFPSLPGGRRRRRGLILVVLALMVSTALSRATGDGPRGGTSRLEATQASVSPLQLLAPTPSVAADGSGAPAATLNGPIGADPLAPPITAPSAGAPGPASAGPASGDAGAPRTTAAAVSSASESVATPETSVPATTPTTSRTPAPTAATSSTTAAPAPKAVSPPPAAAGVARMPAAEAEVVPLTNRDRNSQSLGSLTRDSCLDSIASRYAEQMARSGVLAHDPGSGSAVTGCRPNATWGDNVGTATPCDTARLERDWMASPSHRKNILTGEFQLIGVGAWTDERGGCWVQVLFSS